MLIFVLVFYPLSLTFWLILSLMSHTCFKEAIAATAAWIRWGGGSNRMYSIILSHLLWDAFACPGWVLQLELGFHHNTDRKQH